MGVLRDRMIEEMKLRNFSAATQESYVYAVSRLAKYHHKSPDQLRKEDIRAFLVHLTVERKLSPNSLTPFFPDSAGKKWFACWRTASSGIYRFMSTSDDFSTYVADLLSGTYDCVDRISVRGYFPLGQTSGGLLTWWNQLFPNTALSEQRLRKLAGDFARRVHAFARKHKIPLRFFPIGDKTKHAQAETKFPGLGM